MIVGYVRVSTVEQNEARQLETMEKYGVSKLFCEKVSAKNTERPQLQAMLDFANTIYKYHKDIGTNFEALAEENKSILTVVVHDFSRLARSTKDLLDIVQYLEERQVALISAKENIDSSTPTGKLMLTMIGAINEFERANMLERQREGIAIAKAEGKYKGRKEIKIKNFEEAYNRYLQRQLTKTALAKELNVSRPTLDKLIREYETEHTFKDSVSEDDLKKHTSHLNVK